MKTYSIVLAFVAMLFLLPAVADASCETVCTESSSCGKLCYEDGEKLTCGRWGTCQVEPVCTPNWQPVSTSYAGTLEYNDAQINWCRYYAATKFIERDVNQCNPNNLERYHCTLEPVYQYQGCCGWGCNPPIQNNSACSFVE